MPDMQKLRNSYYRVDYESPIGGITLCSDGNSLCGLRSILETPSPAA